MFMLKLCKLNHEVVGGDERAHMVCQLCQAHECLINDRAPVNV